MMDDFDPASDPSRALREGLDGLTVRVCAARGYEIAAVCKRCGKGRPLPLDRLAKTPALADLDMAELLTRLVCRRGACDDAPAERLIVTWRNVGARHEIGTMVRT